MGAGASVEGAEGGAGDSAASSDSTSLPPKVTQLKQLPEAIEEAIFVDEKFPVIIDPTEQAGRFLKYQVGTFILADIDHAAMQKENLNKSLLGALQYGRTLTLKFANLENVKETIFQEGYFPREILDRSKFYQPEVWKSILQPDALGDTEAEDFIPSQEFAFIIVTSSEGAKGVNDHGAM